MINMKMIRTDEELCEITGGATLTSSIINAIVAGAKIVLEIGRSLGSALRKSTTNTMC